MTRPGEPSPTRTIRGVVFDLDGTLFEADYDWPAIKRRLGVDRPDGSILEYLDSLPPAQREPKRRLLEQIEDRATRDGSLRPGVLELLEFLRGRGLRLALATNNRRENADRVIARYGLRFDLVVTRESGSFKPSGDPLLLAARELGLDPVQLAAVGDNEFDLRAARDAGVRLVIIVNDDVARFRERCDHAVRSVDEVRAALAEALGDGAG